MDDTKQIGTAVIDGDEVELVGATADDNRWEAHAIKGDESTPIDIPSQANFGKLKQATAERFQAPQFQFSRHQPGVDRSEPQAPVEDSPAEEPTSEVVEDEEPAEQVDEPAAAVDEVEEVEQEPEAEKSEAEHIREYLTANPDSANKDVIKALKKIGVEISSSQVSAARKQLAEQE